MREMHNWCRRAALQRRRFAAAVTVILQLRDRLGARDPLKLQLRAALGGDGLQHDGCDRARGVCLRSQPRRAFRSGDRSGSVHVLWCASRCVRGRALTGKSSADALRWQPAKGDRQLVARRGAVTAHIRSPAAHVRLPWCELHVHGHVVELARVCVCAYNSTPVRRTSH